MSIASLCRLISLANHPKQTKVFTFRFSSASTADKFLSVLEKKQSNVEKTLALVDAKLDPNCVCEVLKRCSSGLSQMGLRFFIWAGLQSNYRLFCDKGDMDMAGKLMKEIGLIDLYPDMITYFAMIKGFCNAGRLEDACELFQGMKGQGFSPNAVAYSVLLECICKYGSSDKAMEFLGEMEKAGGSSSPSVITYTSVIKSFCEKGRTMEALRILDRMGARGCAPNRVTVITLIEGLFSEGNVEEAYRVVDKVAGHGVSDGDCYSALVVSLIRTNRRDEAEKVFRKMLESGAKPDGIASSIMIREICREGRVLDGFRIYDEIERMQYVTSIDSDIYSILLVGLCQQSHSVEAARLARSMLKKKIRLKAPYADKIIEHLKNSGDKELVTQLSRIAR